SRLATYALPEPVGASGNSAPVERSRTLGAVAAGSVSKTTRVVAAEGERGSGTRYQRRAAASKRAGIATAGRPVSAGGPVWVWVGTGVGVVTEGVHELTARARVNTCARYLKVR